MICAHFLKQYDWVTKAQATITEQPWGRIHMDGKPHKHAFTKNTTEQRYAQVSGVFPALSRTEQGSRDPGGRCR